jgi:hypothetical protein
MLHLVIRLTLLALVAHAGWRLGAEYLTHYRFRDAVRQATLTGDRTQAGLRRAVLDAAARFEVPLAEETLVVRLDERHTLVSGVYVKPIEILPRYEYPWTFNWAVETYGAPQAGPPPAQP